MSYTLYTFSEKRLLYFSLSLLCCLVVLISGCASSATPSVSSDGHANASSVSLLYLLLPQRHCVGLAKGPGSWCRRS